MAVLGIDFGTTNSALAVADGVSVETLVFGSGDAAAPRYDTWPSVLFFEPALLQPSPPRARTGRAAIERYFEIEHGRLIQSLKSFLPVDTFTATAVFGQRFELEDLIGLILQDLRAVALDFIGAEPEAVIVGRPVHFVAAKSPAEDAFALQRLSDALSRAGFSRVQFEYEPVAAAYHYESTLQRDELILIGDFGGGTSDFCLMRVGPNARGGPAERIIGTDGVGVAGDAFDRQIIRQIVEPALGRGTEYRTELNKLLTVPQWLYSQFERWHLLSFLKTRETMMLLDSLERQSLEPNKIAGLRTVIETDAGYRLYKAVERTKVELSTSLEASFAFEEGPVQLHCTVSREEFEHWIGAEVRSIKDCVHRLLADTRIVADTIDRVFLTGGSSFVPAVRRVFETLVGKDRVSVGQEFTSVARGLAQVAIR